MIEKVGSSGGQTSRKVLIADCGEVKVYVSSMCSSVVCVHQ
jgi:hypothetical protein